MMSSLVAVVPVFNEAATVGAVVRRLREVCPVIVVDDASTDGSDVRAAAAGAACVLRSPRRAGKGAALRRGFAEALRRNATAVATLDGDGQHDPTDLPGLLAAARAAPEALVVGDRLASGDGDRVPSLRRGAIRAADWLVTRLVRADVRDTQCGFRIYPAALLRAVSLREEGFVLETEALVRGVRAGFGLVSVPIRRIYPLERASRFRALADGGRIAWYLARELWREAGHRLAADGLGRRRVPAAAGES